MKRYFLHAAIHPSNLLLLIGVMFCSLILWNAHVLFVGLGFEGVFLLVVPRCGFFCRGVDETMRAIERAAAAKASEALGPQMSESHRQELAHIGRLVGQTFSNLERTSRLLPHAESMGLEQLLANYGRLAVTHKACRDSLEMTNIHVLHGTVRELEAKLEGHEADAPVRTRELLHQRLTIARRRIECWTRTREHLDVLNHQLAAIVDLAKLVHQESLLPTEGSRVSEAIDQLLAGFECATMAQRELAEIGIEEEPADLDALSTRLARHA